MKITVAWHLNNWTNQGPGSVSVYCTVSRAGFDGWDGRPGLGTISGNRTRYNTFERFIELLDLCRDCVARIKSGPQDAYGRVRESVNVYEPGDYGSAVRTFYEYGSTSPRNRFANMQNDHGDCLGRMIIDYIEDAAGAVPDVKIIRDYILEHIQPTGEH